MIHLPLWASLPDPWSKTPSLLSAVVTERGRWNARLTTACRVLINPSSPPLPCFWPCSPASDYMLTSLATFPSSSSCEDGARTKAEMLPVALHVTVLSSSSCAFLPPLSLVFISSSSWFRVSTSFLSTRRLLGWTPAFSFSLKSSDGSTGDYHRSEDILEDVTWQWTAVFLINNFYKIFISFGLGFLHVSEMPLRRGSWILWNWSYRQLCTTWELYSGPLQMQYELLVTGRSLQSQLHCFLMSLCYLWPTQYH